MNNAHAHEAAQILTQLGAAATAAGRAPTPAVVAPAAITIPLSQVAKQPATQVAYTPPTDDTGEINRTIRRVY